MMQRSGSGNAPLHRSGEEEAPAHDRSAV